MSMYTLEHIISLSYRTTWWMFTKLDRDEVLIVTHLCIGFSANSTQGAVPGQGNLPKIGQWGFPSPKDFFFRLEGYSKKNRIHGTDLKAYGKKRYFFWFHSKVKFLTRLWRLFWLSHLVYFNAISIDLYAIRCFICISFVYFPHL